MAVNPTPCLHVHLTREANLEAHGRTYICASCHQTFTITPGVEIEVVEPNGKKEADACRQD